MTAQTWIISGIAALIALILGAFGFLILLIGLNGVRESTGGAILFSYLVLTLITIILSITASKWAVQTLSARTGWSLWAIAPITIIASAAGVAMMLIVGGLILIVAFGIS
jgi:hypothetical protein